MNGGTMIPVFEHETADGVWRQAVSACQDSSIAPPQASRTGMTQELLHAALTIRDPRQRWIISRLPPINPAFAIVEVVWILTGRSDAAFLNYWNSQLPRFAGLGPEYHGAYGFRLRHHFGLDQLERAYLALQHNPDSRQVALQIWDPRNDYPDVTGQAVDPDIPCNMLSLLKIRQGKLEWMQILRSNDLFRGVPYNIIQFTSLHEVLAGWLGIDVGSYNHLSDSLHIYTADRPDSLIDDSTRAERNTDTLSLPKRDSDQAFAMIGRYIDALIAPGLTRRDVESYAVANDLPPAFHNMLLIVLAEAARRRRWLDVAENVIRNCTNSVLVQVWQRWLSRVQG